MTNPNNAVGTNGAYNGRTSVKAFNDVLMCLSGRGILSGWAAEAGGGMAVLVGGTAGVRDVAIAEDNNGNRTTINNISEAPISVTIPAAPAANSRIDAVVVYVNNPPEGSPDTVDNPAACGIIAVSSAVATNPSVPTDSAIRAAITADGASGSTAFYCILATVRVASGTTVITDNLITAGATAQAGDRLSRLNMTNTATIPTSAVTYYINNVAQSSSGIQSMNITTERNASGGTFKVYGLINLTAPTASSTGEWRFASNLRPSRNLTITAAGIRANVTTSYVVTTITSVNLQVKTDGTVIIAGARQANENSVIYLPPTLYLGETF